MVSAVTTAARRWPEAFSFRPNLASNLTVFCDLDGPLIDVSQRYYKTYQLGLASTQAHYQAQGTTLPLRVLSQQQFWQMKRDRIADVEVARQSGLQDKQVDYFLGQVRQIVNQPALLQNDFLQPGVRYSLKLLQDWRVRLVLVTLRCQTQAQQLLQSYGLAEQFVSIWGTNNADAAYCNNSEQKQTLLAAAAAQAGNRGQCWMIGDTEADVLAGQALGFRTIALTCGIRSQSYLNQFSPTQIHDNLLTAARHLLGVGFSAS